MGEGLARRPVGDGLGAGVDVCVDVGLVAGEADPVFSGCGRTQK